jgi:hypothetical protein
MQQDLTLNKILDVDGGERYFLSIYPELHVCFESPKKLINLRDDDKTASTGLFRHKEAGFWMLKDFGAGSNKAISAHGLCMQVENCDSGEAFKRLATFYGFSLTMETVKPDYSSRLPATGEMPSQVVSITYKELEFHEALTILSKYAWESIQWDGVYAKTDDERLDFAKKIFAYYNLKVVNGYEKVKADGKLVHIYTATKRFPIFAFDEKTFQKIYKPNADKKFRFIYGGKKPAEFTYGLGSHEEHLKGNIAHNAKLQNDAAEKGAEFDKKTKKYEKFDKMLLCSGGSDAINAAALGYRVIWKNSESEEVSKSDVSKIYKYAYNFYNLPDVDHPGRKAAKALAWKYIDVYTVWLPDWLTKKSNRKGGMCKDARDYLNYYSAKSFNDLVNTAYTFRFWDEEAKLNKEGSQVYKYGREQYNVDVNNVRLYNFLEMNGYWKLEDERFKEGYRFISIDGNVVSEVKSYVIAGYIHRFLRERKMREDLRNAIYRSPQLNDSSLEKLQHFEPEFKHYGQDFQYFFFGNTVWKVTAARIEKVKPPDVYVWEHRILKPTTAVGKIEGFEPDILKDFFSIAQDGGDWIPTFHDTNCDILKFMLLSSRIHWRAELEDRMCFHELEEKEQEEFMSDHNLTPEIRKIMLLMNTEENQAAYNEKYAMRLDGSLLTDEEQKEQMLTFVNRIFVIGYLLHRYKDKTKSWAVFVMDYLLSEDGVSNGRSGKGMLGTSMEHMLETFKVDARNQKLFDDNFIWGGVQKGNDLIYMEDWDVTLNFERMYNPLSSSLFVNPKGLQPVTYSFPDYGKFLIDTNYSDRYMSGSAKGRKVWAVFSDYFHEDMDRYNEFRTPATVLGRRMFDDWDNAEWNKYYNFMGQCLKFYLTYAKTSVKINPPFGNITKRNNLGKMGENFKDWADSYFEDRMNVHVSRTAAYEHFMQKSNLKSTTSQTFLKKLVAWAEFYQYKFNPEHVDGWRKPRSKGTKYGSIKKSEKTPDNPSGYTSVEYVYFETTTASDIMNAQLRDEQPTEPKQPKNDLIIPKYEKPADDPF